MPLPRSWSEQDARRRKEAKKKGKAAKKRKRGRKKTIVPGLLYWK